MDFFIYNKYICLGFGDSVNNFESFLPLKCDAGNYNKIFLTLSLYDMYFKRKNNGFLHDKFLM